VNIDKLIKEYWKSPNYKALSEKSRKMYDSYFHRIADHFREKDVATIKRSDVIKLVNEYADRPAAANMVLSVSSVLFSFAMDIDVIPYNPAARIKKLKIGEHIRWTPEEAKAVVAAGDRIVSVAVALAWYTGQREGDVLAFQWKSIKDGYINVIQSKTNVEIGIKLHPDLLKILEDIRGDEPEHYYIVSGQKPIKDQAFRGRLIRTMEKLGFHRTFHGIRKSVASELAEKGRSTKEIAAILGHKTTRMAEFYSKQASNKKMAENAVANLTGCL
jgi:integrase